MRHYRPNCQAVFFLIIVFAAVSGCVMEEEFEEETSQIEKLLVEGQVETSRIEKFLQEDDPLRREVVYEEIHTKTGSETRFSTTIEGSLNDEKKQLVARPYRNLIII